MQGPAWRYLGDTLEPSGGTRIQLCGRVVIRIGGKRLDDRLPGRQGRLLFVYLAANRNRFVRRAELIGAVWPWDPPPGADSALSALLSKLRRGLGEGVVAGRTELRLELPNDAWVDLEAAAEAIHRAEAAVAQSDWRRAWGPAHVAVHVANRGFLDDEDLPWAEERRRELGDLLLRGLDCIAATGLGLGPTELPTAKRAAVRLIREAPFRESGHGFLMQVLAAEGNLAEALHVYERLRRLLRTELGIPPGPELQALHRRLLEQRAA